MVSRIWYVSSGSRPVSSVNTRTLDEIREAYHKETVTFRWQKGDLLMLDNMLVAHGREPFVGQRSIVVAMSEPFAPTELIL